MSWFADNWLLLTLISVALYVGVHILEKIVNRKKKEVVSDVKETEDDVQL